MKTVKLPNDQWKKIVVFLRICAGIRVGNEAQCRQFVEGVLWMARSGAQWRLLPAEYGDWNAVYKRFARWCVLGIWEQMLAHFASDPDMEALLIDSTAVRAHPCAAGASKKTVGKLGKRWDVAEAVSPPKST